MATSNDAARERGALNRRRKLRQLLGLVVCVLVVIGAVSVVSGTVHLITKAFDDTDEKLAFESRLQILVALDPVPFETLADANQTTLLDAAIWQAIAEIDRESVERDEVGAMYLPAIDADRAAAQLYGADFKFPHETFESRGQTYTYVEEKEAYLIPITSAVADFSPKVMKIKREGDTKRVTVGYISKYGAGGEFSITASETPVKYYDYIFTKHEGNYYLSAIVASEMKAEASASSSQPQYAASLDPQAALQQAVSQPESVAQSTPDSTAEGETSAASEVSPE